MAWLSPNFLGGAKAGLHSAKLGPAPDAPQLRVTSVDVQADSSGPSDVRWPVRSGPVLPLAEGFIRREETVPGLQAPLGSGTVVLLVPGDHVADAGGWAGSCGKTQLAAYTAEALLGSGAVDLVAWVTASDRASLLSGYMEAAAAVGLDGGGDAEAVAARFASWLATTSRPWLVVLDDLRDVAALEGLWPGGPEGRVLVTAPDATAVPPRRQAVALPVPAFSIRESTAYLFGRMSTDPDQRSGVIDLAEDLGGEPTALAQAAAVIASSGILCREYQEYFARVRAASGSRTAAAVTWTLSVEYAGELLPGGGTWPLLVLAALCGGHGIPAQVLTGPAACRYLASEGTAPAPDSGRAWATVQALEQAGLVSTDMAGASPAVWMAGPLQAAVRAAAPQDMLDRAAGAAADALLEAWPKDRARSGVAAQLRACAASLWRAAGDALWPGGSCHRLLLAAGHSMISARMSVPAVSWWRDVAVGCERLLGAAHPDTLVAAGQVADAMLAAGRAAESAAWSQRVLTSRVEVLGPDHPGTIAARVTLGRALTAVGEPGEAVAVLREAVVRTEHVPGPGDDGALTARDEYAAACLAAGQAAEAIGTYKRTLAALERLRGPDDPAVLAAATRLAAACLAGGRTRDAVSQYKRVLAARERAVGPDHPDTLAVRAGLAAAYDAAGQLGTALREQQLACAGYERALGADHVQTLASQADLARAYHTVGQLGDAVTLLHAAIARSEQVLPPGDPASARLRQALADITAETTAQ
jgi:tetratricopeptide (TPR) repeat protein